MLKHLVWCATGCLKPKKPAQSIRLQSRLPPNLLLLASTLMVCALHALLYCAWCPARHSLLLSDIPAAGSKRVWAAQRSTAEAASDAVLSIAKHSFTAPAGTSSGAAWLSNSPQLAHLLSTEGPEDGDGGNGQVSHSEQLQLQLQQQFTLRKTGCLCIKHFAGCLSRFYCPSSSNPLLLFALHSQEPNQRRLGALESLKRLAAEKSNKAYKQQGAASASASGGCVCVALFCDAGMPPNIAACARPQTYAQATIPVTNLLQTRLKTTPCLCVLFVVTV